MKKFLAIILCVLLTFASCVVWNYADIWAKATDSNAHLFDAFAAFLLIGAMACSCWYFEQKKDGTEKDD